MTYTILKRSREFVKGYKVLLESIQKKHGDTDGKEIQNLIDRINQFLPELEAEIKEVKPSKAITAWNKGTHDAMKNYHPVDTGRPC